MEDIDGGLHPAVDGQSLDEDEEQARSIALMGLTEYCCENLVSTNKMHKKMIELTI